MAVGRPQSGLAEAHTKVLLYRWHAGQWALWQIVAHPGLDGEVAEGWRKVPPPPSHAGSRPSQGVCPEDPQGILEKPWCFPLCFLCREFLFLIVRISKLHLQLILGTKKVLTPALNTSPPVSEYGTDRSDLDTHNYAMCVGVCARACAAHIKPRAHPLRQNEGDPDCHLLAVTF